MKNYARKEKLGAPLGHKGATRKMPQPTETIKHFLTNCPNCNNFLKKLLYTEERIIEEIPEPQPIKVTKHIIGFYNCKNCGIVTAKTYLPNEGSFGKNVLAQTTLMKYDEVKPLYQRAKLKEKCENELRQWLDVTKSYKELKTVRTKIENGFEHWFTCIIHPEVEPTNNRAERMLREQVVIRKITGTLRNEKGTTANETMMSLITTWKQQNKNPFLELRALL